MLETLLESGIRPTAFFYNPGIHPEREYELRKREDKRFCDKVGVEHVDADYDVEAEFARCRQDAAQLGVRPVEHFPYRVTFDELEAAKAVQIRRQRTEGVGLVPNPADDDRHRSLSASGHLEGLGIGETAKDIGREPRHVVVEAVPSETAGTALVAPRGTRTSSATSSWEPAWMVCDRPGQVLFASAATGSVRNGVACGPASGLTGRTTPTSQASAPWQLAMKRTVSPGAALMESQ